jgi:hypothetical protein
MITLFQTTTVGAGGVAQINFNSIPQTAKDLMLVLSLRSTTANTNFSLFANADFTATNYNNVFFNGASSITTAVANTALAGVMNSSSMVANSFGVTTIIVPNYTSSFLKRALIECVSTDASSTPNMRIAAWGWTGTAAITDLRLSDFTFAQNSTASLYLIS